MMQQMVLDVRLDTAPTLDNFCAGNNTAALAHLRLWLGAASASPVRSPVPIYLWGAPSSGKTHLLRAVFAALAQRGEAAGWLDASMAHVPAFDERWSAVFLDDVHAFDAAQQHSAFTAFVNAQTRQIAVIAAGNAPPADLPLRDDLRSRLGWGHVFALQVLDDVQRRDVLRASALARGLVLSDEVLDYVLARFSRDLASLMALLDLLDGYALQTRRAITVPLIKSMMNHV